MGKIGYRKISSLKTAADFQSYLDRIGVALPFDTDLESPDQSPLNRPCQIGDKTIGNRFCVLPMEGWDAQADGKPGELTKRRWQRFGLSGAKLIWGGEACAVCPQGRSNPHQLMINDDTVTDIAKLRQLLLKTHEQHFGNSKDLLIGLQLAHSGRFSRPEGNQLQSSIVYNHPILDRQFGTEGHKTLSDTEVEKIIQDFVKAGKLAWQAGFDFVDIKHCHGYLGHEFLSAVDRKGPYGGSFENRTRFCREIVRGIQAETSGLEIGVRLSIFDFIPFIKGKNGTGEPQTFSGEYRYAFGGDGTGLGIDLTEPLKFLDMLAELQIKLICTTAGSPYYNPHIQRPAFFPPSDGYLPPEDPLIGVARQIDAVAQLKKARPEMTFIGAGYSYLQEWLPHVARQVINTNMADFVGLGRMMLPYPEIVTDILAARKPDPKRLCRTISQCTTAARQGLVSGCYPLDKFYKSLPEYQKLRQFITQSKA